MFVEAEGMADEIESWSASSRVLVFLKSAFNAWFITKGAICTISSLQFQLLLLYKNFNWQKGLVEGCTGVDLAARRLTLSCAQALAAASSAAAASVASSCSPSSRKASGVSGLVTPSLLPLSLSTAAAGFLAGGDVGALRGQRRPHEGISGRAFCFCCWRWRQFASPRWTVGEIGGHLELALAEPLLLPRRHAPHRHVRHGSRRARDWAGFCVRKSTCSKTSSAAGGFQDVFFAGGYGKDVRRSIWGMRMHGRPTARTSTPFSSVKDIVAGA
ncbi:hypothetical protein ZWY2020_034457 [Hordeum vulgare]|nr:hypothetical protein ZWY2020_034457 [Hordeum vulgare]